MKMTLKELEAELAEIKSLPKAQRDKKLATLKSASIYEVTKNDKGEEVETPVTVQIVESADEPVATKAVETEKNEDAEIEKKIQKAVKSALEDSRKTAEVKRINFEPVPQVFSIPKHVRRASLKHIRDYAGQEKSAQERAYRMGMWGLALATGSRKARSFCEGAGLFFKFSGDSEDGFNKATPHSEGINAVGGVLVPPEIDEDLIVLREQFGVFRQRARNVPMAGDSKSRRRRTGGLTAYHVGEGIAITHSKIALDMINLVAKKIGIITTVTNELNEDSAISFGDLLAGEIAYAFANTEDSDGFNGDGTSTYGGIVGVRTRLTNVNGVDDGGGLAQASGSTWTSIVLGDFNKLVGLLPQYADTPNSAFFCHKAFWAGVMQKLELAAGGVTSTEIVNGVRTPMFLGYPVVVSQVFPATTASATVPCVFGDLSLAADYGDRRQTTISFSDSATVDGVSVFETDEYAVRGTERFDINVHDVGTATAAGPIVGLITQ